MSRRTQIYVLVGLLVCARGAAVFHDYRGQSRRAPAWSPPMASSSLSMFASRELRLDLLAKLQKLEYSGTHRNIFVAAPPPPPQPAQADTRNLRSDRGPDASAASAAAAGSRGIFRLRDDARIGKARRIFHERR